jgi:hypothetical protein
MQRCNEPKLRAGKVRGIETRVWESNVVERGNITLSQSLRTGWSGILDSRYDLDDEAIEMTCWLMNAD